LAGWGASYLKLRSTVDAANVEMVKLAAQIIQSPRTHPGLLDWAIERLAKDARIAISPERRQQMMEVLAMHPETSFETVLETHGSAFPELKRLVERLETYDFWTEKKGAVASVSGTQAPDGQSQKPAAPAKEITDRIPEDAPPDGQGAPPLSGTVIHRQPGKVIDKQ
jgi:hypothetical protein